MSEYPNNETIESEMTPASDHDSLIDMVADVRHMKAEIQSLREWRHEVVAPVMIVIQAAQKASSDQVSRLEDKIDRVLDAMFPLSGLPGDFRNHVDDDHRAFDGLREDVVAILTAVGENRTQRAIGETRVLKWVGGLIVIGLLSLVGAMWTLLTPHIGWPR